MTSFTTISFFPRLFILPFLALAFLSSFSNAQDDEFEVPESFQGRYSLLSNQAPITTYLKANPDTISDVRKLSAYISHIEKAITTHLKTKKLTNPSLISVLRPCNLSLSKRSDWGDQLRKYFGIRGWTMPETSCITEVQDKTFTFQNSHFTVDNIFNLVTSFTTKLSVHAKAIPRLRITNWTHADALFDFQFVTTSLTCSVTPIAAVRPAIADQWYINIAFTNPKRVMHVPRDHRKTIMEYVTADDNNAFKKPLAMQLPKEANATGLLGNGTTLLVSSRGEAVASYVGQTYPEENEAVIESMGKADIFIQQVTDALSPSGVAILILPLGVALVPIALLADVSTVFMLIYTLMTDVLIVIPLGIKGLELIGIGNNRFRTISVRMSGFMSGEDSETAGAELFAAECRAKDYVRPIGVLFVCLSLVFMTLGIIAEMVALRFVNSRRRRKKTWLKEEIKKICLNGEGCQGLRCTGCTLGTRFRRSHIPK